MRRVAVGDADGVERRIHVAAGIRFAERNVAEFRQEGVFRARLVLALDADVINLSGR